MKPYLKEFIDNVLLKNGIDVMIPKDERSNYAMFFVGGQMFYFQEDHFEGQLSFSSCHIPQKGLGSGLGLHTPYHGIVVDSVDIDYINNLPKKLTQIWRIQLNQVKKYTSFEHYLSNPVNKILKYTILKAE